MSRFPFRPARSRGCYGTFPSSWQRGGAKLPRYHFIAASCFSTDILTAFSPSRASLSAKKRFLATLRRSEVAAGDFGFELVSCLWIFLSIMIPNPLTSLHGDHPSCPDSDRNCKTFLSRALFKSLVKLPFLSSLRFKSNGDKGELSRPHRSANICPLYAEVRTPRELSGTWATPASDQIATLTASQESEKGQRRKLGPLGPPMPDAGYCE
ncbi:hypothetical protein NDU88_007155 [Pleurodeles waltl]|uniref:Uncharacterized protein n=1 Tax=Pleurodeles waltl TaxID=8319 RepID=A0AAV7M245_PLEWA|nr:hypothetical protein NDU88_007155 [Pleurodeles waltl]